MKEPQTGAAAGPFMNQHRRRFVGGFILGGACGSIATAVALHRRLFDFSQYNNGPTTNLSSTFGTLDHKRFMREAIARATKVPQRPFGAVIVLAEKAEIVAEGFNRWEINPTYHGELDAINRCAQWNRQVDWSGLVLYTTAEPCSMCQSAVLWAGIGMVVFGSSIPFLASQGWRQPDIRAEEVIRRTPFGHCTLLGGIMEEECNALFRESLKRPSAP